MNANGTTFTLIPWDGGHANVTVGIAGQATQPETPMTKLAPGKGWLRFSADGVYRYAKEGRCGWYVTHVPSGIDITDMVGGAGGWGSLADARRWTHTNPVPEDWNPDAVKAV